ncbi:hypothetical protein EMCG_03464 [[Emmonsia] crescens]|uniref:Uncharacterized protein n=1 Tax=[Emmonsia] crescens TaxID=73230 RepID=A0A0G2HVB6_9EURO|nr:hypothetical protein EMCG_03464 [Emmonsia crescens UAMH 3008]
MPFRLPSTGKSRVVSNIRRHALSRSRELEVINAAHPQKESNHVQILPSATDPLRRRPSVSDSFSMSKKSARDETKSSCTSKIYSLSEPGPNLDAQNNWGNETPANALEVNFRLRTSLDGR